MYIQFDYSCWFQAPRDISSPFTRLYFAPLCSHELRNDILLLLHCKITRIYTNVSVRSLPFHCLSSLSPPLSLSDIPIPFNPRFRDRTTNASDPDDAIDGISSSNNLHGQVESFLCTFFQSFHYAIKIVRVTRMMMIALLRFRECNVYKMLGMWVSRLEGRINAITGDLVLSLLHVYIYNFCLCFSKNVARISHNASCIRDRLSFHSPLVQSRSL